DGDAAEVVEEQRRRAVRLDLDRKRINRDDFSDRLHISRERARAVGRSERNTTDAGNHVIGREVAAVVELDAGTQPELPSGVVNSLPAFGERRLYLLMRSLIDEAVEYVTRQSAVRSADIDLRIHRRRRGGKADSQISRHRREGNK